MLKTTRLLAVLLFTLAFDVPTFALPRAIAPTPVQGQISQIVYGPNGKPAGLILGDHTLLEFPSESLIEASVLRPGDMVSATGVEVLSAPNRVFDQVALKKGAVTLFDNSLVAAPPESVSLPAGFVAGFKAMAASAPLMAVSSTSDGLVSGLVLEDGSNVQIPYGGYVNPSSLRLGEIISASGAGKIFSSPGKFLHAQTMQTVGGQSLIQARGYDGEKWMMKLGQIQQALVTPRGEVDGFLLTDNWAIRFLPVPSDRVAKLTPGTQISAAGPSARNQIGADSLIVITNSPTETFVSLVPASAGSEAAGMPGQLAGQVPPPQMIPMQDSGKIVATFLNSHDQIDTIVLDDGTRVWVPPRLRIELKNVREGQRIAVTGMGGTYALGTSLIARTVV